MPYTPAEGSAGLIAALLTPYDNYAAKSAARQEAAQLQTVLAQQAQLDLAKEQQAAANTEAYFQKIRSLPFVGKDLTKLRQHVAGEQTALEKRLASPTYNGNFRKFWAAEGPKWQAEAGNRLINSEVYQNGMRNVENVNAAQEAKAKGEYLAGNGEVNNYQTGEQRLQDFLMGKTDNFVHTGSYKPNGDEDWKEIRNSYAIGRMPWEPVKLTEQEKLDHLTGLHGREIGVDKFMRGARGIDVYHKYDPITKMYDFQRDQRKEQRDIATFNMHLQAHKSTEQLKSDQHQKNLAQLSDAATPFGEQFFAHADEEVPLPHASDANKKLLNSGIDLSGTNRLAGYTLYDNSDRALAAQLGLQKTTSGQKGNQYQSYGRGNITEGFTTANGVHAFQLPTDPTAFEVLDYSPKLYTDPRNIAQASRGEAVHGFAKVRIRFRNHAAAEAAGLYKERFGWLPDSSTKAGTGVYDPDTKTAEIYVPTKINRAMLKSVQKATSGQKAANEGYDASQPFSMPASL